MVLGWSSDQFPVQCVACCVCRETVLHRQPLCRPSVRPSVCHILTKHDMVFYKKTSSNCRCHERRLCGSQTSLRGVSEPDLHLSHISTELGEFPCRKSPFKCDECLCVALKPAQNLGGGGMYFRP